MYEMKMLVHLAMLEKNICHHILHLLCLLLDKVHIHRELLQVSDFEQQASKDQTGFSFHQGCF